MSAFYNLQHFSHTQFLEENTSIFTEEILHIPSEIMVAWHEKGITTGEWAMFPLILAGQNLPFADQLLPRTLALLNTTPVVQATVSVLKAGSEILPHTDTIDNDVLLSSKTYRLQLGIKIPENCALTVDSETRLWEKGKVLAFDSSKVHSAFNRSNEDRIVLIIDYAKDGIVITNEEMQNLQNYYMALYNF
jgi:aspartyl/asparaginyl beta-hydroxylase (cupin superfamily)